MAKKNVNSKLYILFVIKSSEKCFIKLLRFKSVILDEPYSEHFCRIKI